MASVSDVPSTAAKMAEPKASRKFLLVQEAACLLRGELEGEDLHAGMDGFQRLLLGEERVRVRVRVRDLK